MNRGVETRAKISDSTSTHSATGSAALAFDSRGQAWTTSPSRRTMLGWARGLARERREEERESEEEGGTENVLSVAVCCLQCWCACFTSSIRSLRAATPRGPCRSTSLSRTLRDLPERLHAACSSWGMMAGTRQAPAAAALVLSSPPCLAVTPARRGRSEAARGLSQWRASPR